MRASFGDKPWFAKDPKMAARAINARVETVSDKPSFRESFVQRRCLVPAGGFYEWERKAKAKLPHYIHAANGTPLAFAGLWSSWNDPETGERLRTCTILTGRPNALVAPIHDRMPVQIQPDLWSRWLDPHERDPETIVALLHDAEAPDMARHAVSTLVNTVQNNLPELIAPLG